MFFASRGRVSFRLCLVYFKLDTIFCTIAPYFKVHDGKLEAFKLLCEQFVEKTNEEPKCLYYGFSFDEDQVHCREGYVDSEGLLHHLENVGSLLKKH
jgi:hypothetical protein